MSKEEVEKEFAGKGYGDFKVAVANSVIEELRPLQEKYKDIKENPDYLEKVYKEGAEKAAQVADKTLKDVYQKIGLII